MSEDNNLASIMAEIKRREIAEAGREDLSHFARIRDEPQTPPMWLGIAFLFAMLGFAAVGIVIIGAIVTWWLS